MVSGNGFFIPRDIVPKKKVISISTGNEPEKAL